MRFRHLTLAASLVALAACQDSPVMEAGPVENDFSKVTILKPEQYAAHGIASLPRTAAPSMVIGPCEIDNPDSCGGDPPEPQYAYFDYYTHVYNESDYWSKNVRLHSKSDSHANVSETVLEVSYRSVGGCWGTPGEFDYDYLWGSGTPVYLVGERYASYSYGMTFKWGVNAWHTFTASPGYYITGYYTSYTFPTSHEDCV